MQGFQQLLGKITGVTAFTLSMFFTSMTAADVVTQLEDDEQLVVLIVENMT